MKADKITVHSILAMCKLQAASVFTLIFIGLHPFNSVIPSTSENVT